MPDLKPWPTAKGEHAVGTVRVRQIRARNRATVWLDVEGYKTHVAAWRNDLAGYGFENADDVKESLTVGKDVALTIKTDPDVDNGLAWVAAIDGQRPAKRTGNGSSGAQPRNDLDAASRIVAACLQFGAARHADFEDCLALADRAFAKAKGLAKP